MSEENPKLEAKQFSLAESKVPASKVALPSAEYELILQTAGVGFRTDGTPIKVENNRLNLGKPPEMAIGAAVLHLIGGKYTYVLFDGSQYTSTPEQIEAAIATLRSYGKDCTYHEWPLYAAIDKVEKHISRLQAENARLKAEVERYKNRIKLLEAAINDTTENICAAAYDKKMHAEMRRRTIRRMCQDLCALAPEPTPSPDPKCKICLDTGRCCRNGRFDGVTCICTKTGVK